MHASHGFGFKCVVIPRRRIAGDSIAIAAPGIASPSHAAGKDQEQPGRCYGINACKGERLCATAKNGCKGRNQCKGQGVIAKTPTECMAPGGTPTEKEQVVTEEAQGGLREPARTPA
ncbi:hypothetical protein [Massilia sp. CT11-137]|uniref:BufA2 family periplasmic bufferin-type metallophore n=1 Tax=Massilia sp. CT11-137 TaxID=3393901 RepID=UPI0039AEDB62